MDILTHNNCRFQIPVESIGRMELQDISESFSWKTGDVLTKVSIEFFDRTLMVFVLAESEMLKFAEEYKRTHKCQDI